MFIKIIITIFSIISFYVIFVMYFDIKEIIKIYQDIESLYLILIFILLSFTVFVRSQIQRLLLNTIGINLTIKQNYVLFLTGF